MNIHLCHWIGTLRTTVRPFHWSSVRARGSAERFPFTSPPRILTTMPKHRYCYYFCFKNNTTEASWDDQLCSRSLTAGRWQSWDMNHMVWCQSLLPTAVTQLASAPTHTLLGLRLFKLWCRTSRMQIHFQIKSLTEGELLCGLHQNILLAAWITYPALRSASKGPTGNVWGQRDLNSVAFLIT